MQPGLVMFLLASNIVYSLNYKMKEKKDWKKKLIRPMGRIEKKSLRMLNIQKELRREIDGESTFVALIIRYKFELSFTELLIYPSILFCSLENCHLMITCDIIL